MRERQSEAAPKSSCCQFVIDKTPHLVAIDDCGMIQPCKAFKRKLALPNGMTAPRNYDVVLLRKRLHYEPGRKVARVREIPDGEVERSVAELVLGHRKQPIEPAGLHLQLA